MNPTSNEMAAEIAVQTVIEVIKGSVKGLEAARSWLSSKNTEYDPLRRSAKRYADRFIDRYNRIRILGMSDDISLDELYVRLNLLESIPSRSRRSISEMYESISEMYKEMLSRGFKLRSTWKCLPAFEVVNKFDNITVLGKPGSGKTTLLKMLGLAALDGNLKRKSLPVFISLKEWSETDLELFNYICRQFDICGFPDANLFVERMLQKGGLLILLDGFDEVTCRFDRAVDQVTTLCDKYPKSRYILSCRTAAYVYVFRRFRDVEIADFNDKQIKSFVGKWFRDDHNKAERCWHDFSQDENAGIKELSSTPLLLTMLCLAFGDSLRFPPNRSELYKEGLDALMRKWDASRGIKRRDTYRLMSLRNKEALLSYIAIETQKEGEQFIPNRMLYKYVIEFCENLPFFVDQITPIEPELLINAIESQHGLLVERVNGVYSFSHLTFQEYFAARYLVDNEARGDLIRVIENHFNEDAWREVILLTAGMLTNADQPVLLLRQKIGEIGSHAGMHEVLDTARNAVWSDSYSIPLTTAFFLGYSISSNKQLKTTANDIAEGLYQLLGIKERERLMLDLDKEAAKKKSRSIERKESSKIEELLRDYRITEELVDYLKATSLLVSYLNADCYLAREVRLAVIAGLLNEPWKLDLPGEN